VWLSARYHRPEIATRNCMSRNTLLPQAAAINKTNG